MSLLDPFRDVDVVTRQRRSIPDCPEFRRKVTPSLLDECTGDLIGVVTIHDRQQHRFVVVLRVVTDKESTARRESIQDLDELLPVAVDDVVRLSAFCVVAQEPNHPSAGVAFDVVNDAFRDVEGGVLDGVSGPGRGSGGETGCGHDATSVPSDMTSRRRSIHMRASHSGTPRSSRSKQYGQAATIWRVTPSPIRHSESK